MNYLTPHEYLRQLKELLKQELQKIKEQKNLIAEFQEYETAILYRDFEKKLVNFLGQLQFKKSNNMEQLTFEHLQWQPWIGADYQQSDKKLLIVGESHYDSDIREGDLDCAECIQWFIKGVGIDEPNNPQPLIRNLERAFYGDKPTLDQKQKLWNSAAYHILIQRPLKNIKERPNNDDYVSGWKKFFDIALQLKPDYCLFCGVEAAAYNGAFIEAAQEKNFKAENISHGKKVGDVAVRHTTIVDEESHQAKLVFIRHPSSFFRHEEWSEVLEEEMPEFEAFL